MRVTENLIAGSSHVVMTGKGNAMLAVLGTSALVYIPHSYASAAPPNINCGRFNDRRLSGATDTDMPFGDPPHYTSGTARYIAALTVQGREHPCTAQHSTASPSCRASVGGAMSAQAPGTGAVSVRV